MKGENIILFDLAPSGHRMGYLKYLESVISERPVETRFGTSFNNALKLIRSERVLLSSADHYLLFTALVGGLRRLIGRRTNGLYIAAEKQVWANGLTFGLKGAVMRALFYLKFIDARSITPFEWSPKLKSICSGWLYDLQFCAPNSGDDIAVDKRESEFIHWVNNQSRDLVVLLGNVSERRGLATMMEASRLNPDFQFLVAGRGFKSEKIRADYPNIKFRLGSLSETGFSQIVETCDYVWCCFSEEYDQNSGLFCNAVRCGKMVVVRKGSFLHWLAIHCLKGVEEPEAMWMPEGAVMLRPMVDYEQFLAEVHQRVLTWVGELAK